MAWQKLVVQLIKISGFQDLPSSRIDVAFDEDRREMHVFPGAHQVQPGATMADPVHIRSLRHFLKETHVPGAVFRGQTTDHGSLKPSLFRSDLQVDIERMNFLFSDSYARVYEEFYREQYYEEIQAQGSGVPWLPEGWPEEKRTIFNFLSFSDDDEESPFPQFGPGHGFGDPPGTWDDPLPPSLSSEVHARLQHYGIPTRALDVTFDPLIALWFATHRFVSTGCRTGYYVDSAEKGVVYLLTSSEIYDLRKDDARPLGGLRGLRQQGGLLWGATNENPDLIERVAKRLIVTSDLLRTRNPFEKIYRFVFLRRLGTLSQGFLFPESHEDPFYGFLVRAKRGGRDDILRDLHEWRQGGNVTRYVPADKRKVDEKLRVLLKWIMEYETPPEVDLARTGTS